MHHGTTHNTVVSTVIHYMTKLSRDHTHTAAQSLTRKLPIGCGMADGDARASICPVCGAYMALLSESNMTHTTEGSSMLSGERAAAAPAAARRAATSESSTLVALELLTLVL